VGHTGPTGYHGGWAWAGMAALSEWASPAMGGWASLASLLLSSFSFSFFSLFFFGRPNLVFFFFFSIQVFCNFFVLAEVSCSYWWA
jgi:hypothetical protein